MKPLKSMLVILMVSLLFLGNGRDVFASMNSASYQIRWDNIGVGGEDASSSATYRLRDSAGGQGIGQGTSATYDLRSGYREGIFDPVVTFETRTQYRNSQEAATMLSGPVVTVNDASGYSVEDTILLVDNEGVAQDSAIGKITNITGNDITVDAWVDSGSMPTIDGSNDYVYNMSSLSLSFNTLAVGTVTTGVLSWDVTADLPDGYSVYVFENQDLQTSGGASVITDVSDGEVTAGFIEYGARSSDASLASSTFDSQDTAITTTWQEVGSRSGVSWDARDFLTLKVAITGAVTSGTYTQTLTLVYVGDY